MANEITLTFSLTVNKPAVMSTPLCLSIVGAQFTMTGNLYCRDMVSVATSATLIPLGGVTAPHWMVAHNLDATNYLTIRNGSAGADLLKLLAGEWAVCPLLDTAVPYGVANTAACLMEFLVLTI